MKPRYHLGVFFNWTWSYLDENAQLGISLLPASSFLAGFSWNSLCWDANCQLCLYHGVSVCIFAVMLGVAAQGSFAFVSNLKELYFLPLLLNVTLWSRNLLLHKRSHCAADSGSVKPDQTLALWQISWELNALTFYYNVLCVELIQLWKAFWSCLLQ